MTRIVAGGQPFRSASPRREYHAREGGDGSHVLLIPQKGLGVFALTNRTYGDPSGAVWDAAAVLTKAELCVDRMVAVSDELARA